MSNEKFIVGDNVGKPLAWGILEGKKAPQVYVKTSIGLSWFGSLAEGKAMEITLTALVNMGFKYDSLDMLVKDPDGALDKNKDVIFVVEYDENRMDPKTGDPVPKIRWVNSLGGGFKKQMNEKDALAALSSLKVKGDLMAIREEMGVQKPLPTESAPQPSGDIPF